MLVFRMVRAVLPPGVHLKGGQVSAVRNKELADEFYRDIIPVVVDLRRQGLTLRAIAAELDRRGHRTRLAYQGQRWNPTQVSRLLARAAGSRLAGDPP